jgi:Smg protein
MKENVLEVLMFLFENYMDDDPEFNTDQQTLATKLSEAGFQNGEINKAFNWLEDLSTMCDLETDSADGHNPSSVRMYSETEKKKFDTSARGFLLFLEQHGILNPVTREVVIDRVMALESEDFDLEQLKWVIMMVLYNQPGREENYHWIEGLVYNDTPNHLH